MRFKSTIGSVSGHTASRVNRMGTARRASFMRGRLRAVKVAVRRKSR